MSATAESVQQSTQTSSHVQNVPNANLQGGPVVQRNVTTEEHFDSLVDKGLLGKDYGKAPTEEKPQKQAKQAPKVETTPEVKAPEAPKTDAQELQAAQDGDETEETETPPEREFSSLDEYLTEAKLDPETFRDLPVTVKIDGKEEQVSLKEVINSYQMQGHVNNKSMELSNDRKTFEEQRTQASQVILQQITQSQNMLKLAEETLLGDYGKIDWAALRAANPAEYAAAHADYQTRLAHIKGQLQAIEQTQQTQAREAQEARAKQLPQEFAKVLAAIPEWRDEAKRTEGQKQLLDYGRKMGLSDAELTGIDSRQLLILHKAAQYDALQASKAQTLKKVRAAPLMAKPGARTNTTPQDAARQSAREAFMRNPRDEDTAAAYFERFA